MEKATDKLEQIAIGCKFLKETAKMHLEKDLDGLKKKTPEEWISYVNDNIDFILRIVKR